MVKLAVMNRRKMGKDISLNDKWYIISEMRVKNVLFDALKEYSSIVFDRYKVKAQKRFLTIEEVGKFGDYLFGYEGGNWAIGGSHKTISSVTEKMKLQRTANLKIVLAKDKNKIIVVDGFHRVVALWQNRKKLKNIQGTIFILSSPYIRSIFPWDLIGH